MKPAPGADVDPLRPPNVGLLLTEGRGLLEAGASVLLSPVLMRAQRGDGHPVLVLPGLLASDLSTALLRRFLRGRGYSAHAWGLGRNTGGIFRMRDKLRARLAAVHQASGRKVSLVGWSLGGVYARDLALFAPDMVRCVITLGSPFSGDVTATHGGRVYEALSGEKITDQTLAELKPLSGALPVPTTSIYSRCDGIVNWRTSVLDPSPTAENIEILLASHIGLVAHPAVLWVIADRLAQPEGHFQPFGTTGPFTWTYRLSS